MWKKYVKNSKIYIKVGLSERATMNPTGVDRKKTVLQAVDIKLEETVSWDSLLELNSEDVSVAEPVSMIATTASILYEEPAKRELRHVITVVEIIQMLAKQKLSEHERQELTRLYNNAQEERNASKIISVKKLATEMNKILEDGKQTRVNVRCAYARCRRVIDCLEKYNEMCEHTISCEVRNHAYHVQWECENASGLKTDAESIQAFRETSALLQIRLHYMAFFVHTELSAGISAGI